MLDLSLKSWYTIVICEMRSEGFAGDNSGGRSWKKA